MGMSGARKVLIEALKGKGKALLAWFDREGRALPWRPPPGPWEVWVAETMLQQTRVETVIPYYRRFLSCFPDPESLASAGLEEALALWSGLGYYRRCRFLWEGARRVSAAGAFPTDVSGWKALPGVGSYTAAAIASICFGARVPVVDGNTRRVAARLAALEGSHPRTEERHTVNEVLAALLDRDRPGDSNQALMDLGATVCTPRQPSCGRCPFQDSCLAFQVGNPERFSRKKEGGARQRERETAFFVERNGRILLFRRPENLELLAGLWELPTATGQPEQASRSLEELHGVKFETRERLAKLRHAITTRRIEIEVVRGELKATAVAVREAAWSAGWFTPDEAQQLALTGVTRKWLQRACRLGVRERS